MEEICVVPCGSKKIWDKNKEARPTKAKNVYIGTFAKKCKQYAQEFYPGSWCILSAKYGFLFPEDIVPEPYNVTFNDKSTNPIAIDSLTKQKSQKGLDQYKKIVVLGGKKYVSIVKEVFKNKEVINPLADCRGIGYMMKKLNDAIKDDIMI